jgi:hypothetical protein
MTKCLSAKLFSNKRRETFPGPTSFDQITLELQALCQHNNLWTLIGRVPFDQMSVSQIVFVQ